MDSRQLWRLSPFHRRKHCWCARTSLPANFQCLHGVVLVPFCIICGLHLIAVWFSKTTWLPEWSLQLPLFLAFYLSKGRAGRSNTSLMNAVHMPYTGWQILSCFAQPAHMISKKSATHPSVLLQDIDHDTIHHIVACVCSPLCHHLYNIFHIVAWVCSFVSKHLLASLFVFPPHSLLLLCFRLKSSISSAGHPSSVLLQAVHQSNFAIVAICSHTLARCVLWSRPSLLLPICEQLHSKLLLPAALLLALVICAILFPDI